MLSLNVFLLLRCCLADCHDDSIFLAQALLVISNCLRIIVLSNTVVRFWLLLVHSIICEIEMKIRFSRRHNIFSFNVCAFIIYEWMYVFKAINIANSKPTKSIKYVYILRLFCTIFKKNCFQSLRDMRKTYKRFSKFIGWKEEGYANQWKSYHVRTCWGCRKLSPPEL